MSELVTIKEHIERRTYIKGEFKGKFIGYLDPKKSDLLYENFYDIEVLSGQISTIKDSAHIRHWEEGEPEEYQPLEQFLTKLPDSLPIQIKIIDGSFKNYKINFNEPKLSAYKLTNQVHEKDRVLGDIEGQISGYIKHYDVQDIEVEVRTDIDGETILPPQTTKTKTSKQTNKSEIGGNYKRWEYFNSDGTTYWGNWIKQSKGDGFSLWSILLGIIQLIYFLVLLVPIFTIGWKLIFPLIIIGFLFYFLSAFQQVILRIWSWLIKFIGFAFLFFFAFGILSLFNSKVKTVSKKKYSSNSSEEIQHTKIDPLSGDSIISHFRIWHDYNEKEYSGNIEVKVSDLRNVTNFRNSITVMAQNPNQYNYIVSRIYDFDRNKLGLLYLMFDSLKEKHNLNETQFAEVITSCIQDIPYTLVLDDECNVRRYNDKFISDYLRKGGKCEGYIKFGLLSPTEFMGSLIGDCDTRTLLLFSVLNHYNYDVAMLGSELYRHSVIAINLPYYGISKTINGKKYVIWETTEKGIPPGLFPRELSDMRFWNVTLISNNNQSI